MFETSGAGDDNGGSAPPPAADDRLWRHPSEIAAAARAAAASGPVGDDGGPLSFRSTNRFHRFSLGTVVVAGSLGALAMFGTLAAMGLISGVAEPQGSSAADARRAGVVGTPSTLSSTVDGVVSLRMTTSESTSYGAGLVLTTRGDIVTTLPDVASPGSSAAIETADASWTAATVVGSDPVTGLVVLRPAQRSASLSTTSSLRRGIADVGQAELGHEVRMVRPGTAALSAGFATGPTTQITSTNACIGHDGAMRVGLLTLTSAHRTGPTEVATDASGSTVVGLVVADDDNAEDQMQYAVPAELARRVGLQIVADGQAEHGTLDIGLAESDSNVLAVVSVDPTSKAAASGVEVGDELLSIDGRQVHSANDVAGALLGRTASDTVSVVVRRDNRQWSMVLPITTSPMAGVTTTLP